MFDLTSVLIYCGLLISIMLLLWSKKHNLNATAEGFLASYNKIAVQDIVILCLLAVIVGFRQNVGVDWPAYRDYFKQFTYYADFSFADQKMEIGYFGINYFVQLFGGNYTLVFVISAMISWIFILKSFPVKLLPFTFFFIFCDGYFFWSMNGVRQFMAVGIFAYALSFILKRDLKKYIILIIFAALFHKSVLLLVPFYFLPYKKMYNQKFWLITFLLSFVLAQTPLILNSFRAIFSTLSIFIPFLEVYVHYFDSQYYEIGQMDGSGLGYIFRILIAFVLLLMSKPIIKQYPQTQTYFVLFFIGTVIFNLFFMLQIVGRFATYLIFFRSYLLAILVYYLFQKKLSFVAIGLSILYFVLFLTDIYNSANLCCPYEFSF